MLVNEVFHSIQGESTFTGWPCAFVRLTGCNLRCAYCDTRYAYTEGVERGVEDLVRQVLGFGCGLAEVTGGEPLLQEETPFLARRLLEEGLRVLVETNGSFDIDRLDSRCVRIVDFKGPSSGEERANDYGNLKRLTPRDEVKLVIGSVEDYSFAVGILERLRVEGAKPGAVHFSPVYGGVDPAELAAWMLRDRLNVRLNLQLHKVIWGPDRRGV